jgi:hypothetical protein
MSGTGGFNALVDRPGMYRVQTESGGFQTPFYFGGAQAPTDLFLPRTSFSGSGFHKNSLSKSHPGDLDFTTKKGDVVFHQKGHNIKIPRVLPFMK